MRTATYRGAEWKSLQCPTVRRQAANERRRAFRVTGHPGTKKMEEDTMKTLKRTLFALAMTASAVAMADQPIVGLITKTDTNPFFVKMKQGAQQAADASGATL